jgi:hypothetical protein
MEATYRIINSYSVAFLGYFLKGEKGYAGFLAVNISPDIMIWVVKGVPAAANAAAGEKR